MKRSTLITLIFVAVVIVLAGIIYAASKSNPSASPSPSVTAASPSPSPSTSTSAAAASNSPASTPSGAVTITYNGSGFSPSSVTVPKGGTLTVKNTSTQSVQFDSDPHPVHTDNPELNVGVVSPGQSKSVTVNNPGTWGVHNHLDPSQKATVVIQ
jgi:plastocyanin